MAAFQEQCGAREEEEIPCREYRQGYGGGLACELGLRSISSEKVGQEVGKVTGMFVMQQ